MTKPTTRVVLVSLIAIVLVAAGAYRFVTLKRAADRRDVVVSVTPGMVVVGGTF